MTKAAINTHDVVITFGKHKGSLLTRVPASYLRWMANETFLQVGWPALAKAELDRRGSVMPTIEISGHAIDNASLRVRKIWHETAINDQEGLYSWLQRVTVEAIAANHQIEPGAYVHLGIKFVVEAGEEFPVLKTIMPSKKAMAE